MAESLSCQAWEELTMHVPRAGKYSAGWPHSSPLSSSNSTAMRSHTAAFRSGEPPAYPASRLNKALLTSDLVKLSIGRLAARPRTPKNCSWAAKSLTTVGSLNSSDSAARCIMSGWARVAMRSTSTGWGARRTARQVFVKNRRRSWWCTAERLKICSRMTERRTSAQRRWVSSSDGCDSWRQHMSTTTIWAAGFPVDKIWEQRSENPVSGLSTSHVFNTTCRTSTSCSGRVRRIFGSSSKLTRMKWRRRVLTAFCRSLLVNLSRHLSCLNSRLSPVVFNRSKYSTRIFFRTLSKVGWLIDLLPSLLVVSREHLCSKPSRATKQVRASSTTWCVALVLVNTELSWGQMPLPNSDRLTEIHWSKDSRSRRVTRVSKRVARTAGLSDWNSWSSCGLRICNISSVLPWRFTRNEASFRHKTSSSSWAAESNVDLTNGSIPLSFKCSSEFMASSVIVIICCLGKRRKTLLGY